jgi:hypothetical protein
MQSENPVPLQHYKLNLLLEIAVLKEKRIKSQGK